MADVFFYLDVALDLAKPLPVCCVSQGLTRQMMKLPEKGERQGCGDKYGLVAAQVLREQGMSLVRLWQ